MTFIVTVTIINVGDKTAWLSLGEDFLFSGYPFSKSDLNCFLTRELVGKFSPGENKYFHV